MTKSGIYRITVDRSSEGKPAKSYIGQSKDIEKRWKAHKSIAFNKKSKLYKLPLYAGIRYYGLENVTFEIVELAPRNELNHLEQYYIKEMNTFHDGYNNDSGGDAPTEVSDETRRKKSQALKGVKKSKEHCRAISKAKKGSNNPQWGKLGKDSHSSKAVQMLHKETGKLVMDFGSMAEAASWLIEKGITKNKRAYSHICECCQGINMNAYGYKWKYKEE